MNDRPTITNNRRWSSEENRQPVTDMTIMSKSMPSEASPLSKRFKLFKRKSLHTSRRRSVSADNLVMHSNLEEFELSKRLKLRVTIEEAKLIPDMDTYAIVRCLNHRSRTHVAKKSSQPNWSCSFDMPLMGARRRKTKQRQWKQGMVITVCSKDRFRSQFLGQIQLPFPEKAAVYHDATAHWYTLHAYQRKAYLRNSHKKTLSIEPIGEIKVKIGLVCSEEQEKEETLSNEAINEIWQLLSMYHKQSRSLPSSAPVLKSSTSLPASSASSDDMSRKRLGTRQFGSAESFKTVRKRREKRRGIEGKFHQDVVGVTFLEICHANDLPPEKNLARTSFDMDPFVVVSFGQSTFRTSAVRHNLNPVWNEKLFFHVRHNEANYHLKFTVYDREKFSGNDLVAWCQIPIRNIFHTDIQQGLESSIEQGMDRYTFPLQMAHPEKWKDKRPTLTVRAKFMPYAQIRKMFWVSLAKSYDAENTGTLSRLEVQSLLETMGSTITESTIDKFWVQHNKNPQKEDEDLTLDELVESLENHMINEEQEQESESDSSTRLICDTEKTLEDMYIVEEEEEDDDEDDDEEEDWVVDNNEEEEEEEEAMDTPLTTDEDEETQLTHSPLEKDIDLAEVLIAEEDQLTQKIPLPQISSIWEDKYPYKHGKRRTQTAEKVICLKECPICHRPNLARRSQMDIITHVATCAANDWTTVDRFLMGNFITEAYAQRRWFVKLVRKVGYGKYSPGKDNANILVQDRRTGHLIEEKMSVYIRLGMRLVYKGIQSRGAQRILTNLTVKQGRRFDDPKSAREIPSFIKFHKICLDEVAEPLSSFKTFNAFFYRTLKPGSRPPDSPEDPTVAVSPADSRMTAFETVSEATRLWIKGLDFSLKKLIGDNQSAQDFEGGSLAVFRLAPQDYHRFHSPVDGLITKVRHISGQYYTVNPMAIRTTIDVFGENARTVVWIDSKEFGKVAVVCVGAMLVGSIIITAQVGSEIKRTDEMGYFAFGGSTLVVVFQKDKMHFDHDLLDNSDKAVETLVRVGNHIGVLPR
ncbi:hypothetical protein CU098_008171 [Rhizopus stolonifer]|uniref:Phosphatidylserine decarboxylase proenzyme 2 n=1 Tax=Rhizopus stolonifer TaxID=4846 RepID=A0A367KN06_RHIST|nr:hypothetical protein CU098_008171 [Rhizopus stolonifer]